MVSVDCNAPLNRNGSMLFTRMYLETMIAISAVYVPGHIMQNRSIEQVLTKNSRL